MTVEQHMVTDEYQERLIRDSELTSRIQDGYTQPTPTPSNPSPRIIDGTLDEGAQTAFQELHGHYEKMCNKLAHTISRRYRTSPNIDFEDLQQEAAFGLLHSALKWNVSKKIAFYTQASSTVRNYLNRYAEEQESTIRTPLHSKELVRKYGKMTFSIYQNDERMPKRPRIAEAMGIDIVEIDRIATWEASTLQMGSLEGGYFLDDRDRHSTYGAGEAKWQSAIPGSTEAQTVEDEILLSALLDTVRNTLKPGETDLTDRQIKILKLHFFGQGEGPMSLKDIASDVGLTRERIRQIEVQAIRKLRENPARLKQLRNLLTDKAQQKPFYIY